MSFDETSLLSTSEINSLKALTSSVVGDTLDNYFFDKSNLTDAISSETINLLKSKGIMSVRKIYSCARCNSSLDYCSCNDQEVENKEYLIINTPEFVDYYIRTLENLYNIKHLSINNLQGIKRIKFIDSNESEINLHLYIGVLPAEFIYSNLSSNIIFISLLPINQYDSDNDNMFEWHELLSNELIDKFKRDFKDLIIKNESKNVYILDLGDDIDISIVETIRSTFHNYLTSKGYTSTTEPKKYKPEIIDYTLPNERIKECFIKDNKKIFVIKPTEKEILFAAFVDGIINLDGEAYELIRKFDNFITNKIQKHRSIRNAQDHSSKTEIVIMLVTALINLVSIISGTVSTNPIFSRIKELLSSNPIAIIYVAINILGILVIAQNILIIMRYRYFSWSRLWFKKIV